MEKINIFELNEISEKKNINKLKLYNKLIRNCHNRIKSNAKNNYQSCTYTIPSYTFGFPLYDSNELIDFIMNSLKRDGLKVININNTLYISWDNNEKKNNIQNIKLQNIKLQNNYKPIEDYKPTGNILYDNESMSAIKDKSIQFLNI